MFLDRHPEDGIRVGDRWEEVLYDRLHSVDAVVCVVTEHHVASKWCFAEVALAKVLGHHLLPVARADGRSPPAPRCLPGRRLPGRSERGASRTAGTSPSDRGRGRDSVGCVPTVVPRAVGLRHVGCAGLLRSGARDPNVVAIDLIAGTVNDWVQEPDASMFRATTARRRAGRACRRAPFEPSPPRLVGPAR